MITKSYSYAVLLVSVCLLGACKQVSEKNDDIDALSGALLDTTALHHASGFHMEKDTLGITTLIVTAPWAGAETVLTYALVPRQILGDIKLPDDSYDAIVPVPVERIVVTATTHIAALEALEVTDRLVGFPGTELVSSKTARNRIDAGQVEELGNNETINTERVIALAPDVIIGFGMNGQNKAYGTLKQSGVPVIYNGDWAEESPLGKAEWIKFFGALFQKEDKADSIFTAMESSYNEAKVLAEAATERPTVLTGGLYRDVWHIAGGKSYMARLIEDAQAEYLWADNMETGGVALSLESVIDRAVQADLWLNPSMLTSYEAMAEANDHYTEFKAFRERRVFSNAIPKGPTGGLLYYEIASQRPDLVLKDLIHIFHPELLTDHRPVFFKALSEEHHP